VLFDRYTAVVVDMATESQHKNREVQLDARRTSSVINQAVFQLKQTTDKLKRAYNGESVDWSDDGKTPDVLYIRKYAAFVRWHQLA